MGQLRERRKLTRQIFITFYQVLEKISHQQAVNKAKAEYKKYQVKTISPVEKDYLDRIKSIQEKVDKKGDGE